MNKKLFILCLSIVTVAIITVLLTLSISAAGTVDYSIQSDWGTGAVVNVKISNTDATPMNNWEIAWTFPGNQKITNMWNASYVQNGSSVTIKPVDYNKTINPGESISFGFTITYNGTNSKPTNISLNGSSSQTIVPSITPGTTSSLPSIIPSTTSSIPSLPTIIPTTLAPATSTTYAENSMGYVGASMAQNVADGYRKVGGRRMWGGYGTGGMVIQNWTNTNSSSWQLFDQQVAKYGKPNAVWVQIIIFASQGATYNEVKQVITNTRQHAASGAKIYISGQPLYPEGNVCSLAGANGPQLTDDLAKQAGNDSSLNVEYCGTFTLKNSEVSDGCHANSAGETALGNQAVAKFGK